MLKPTCVLLLSLVTNTLAKMEGFIVGGAFANIEHHAHSAFLSIHCVNDKGEMSGWICSSSIVNQYILLTAAHCLYGCTSQSHIGINAGSENRLRGQTYQTQSFVIHEDYSPKTSQNDLGLLRLQYSISLNKKSARVALMERPPYTEKAVVAGWGMTNEELELQSDDLKYVTQEVWERNKCLELFRYLPKGTFCAANSNPVDYAAQGDSGSALVVRGYIQIGLVSFKMPSIAPHVVVYTDVGNYYKWIRYYARYLLCLK